jgi:SpoVK/Ycf46/Vps4 family AAA+-type ATPase
MNPPFPHLAGLGKLKAWFASHLQFLQQWNVLDPRGIVLAGLPGTGRRSVAKAMAERIGRPWTTHTNDPALDPSVVLLVEDLDREHLPLIRRLADPDEPMPFVIATAERPWELPAGLFRPDAIESVWHLDLPDIKERAELWDLAAKRRGIAHPGFDQVNLARASHELTHGEIHAAFDSAMRASYPKEPREKHLLDALVEIRHFGSTKHDDLARMAAWAVRCACSARSI